MFNKLVEMLTCVISKLPHFVTIPPDCQAIVLRFGKYVKTFDEGGHYLFHFPLIHTVMQVVCTRQLIDIDKQDILTADGHSITLNASIEYVIDEPYKALLSVIDYDEQLQEFAGDLFREAIMSRSLEECIEEIDIIKLEVFEGLEEEADKQYGICVLEVYIPTFTKAKTIRLIQE
jgi:regulator of protease activity HflC (stomatin/prohibitin superfamily)